MRLLIADHDPDDDRLPLLRACGANGWLVQTTDSGEDAIEQAERFVFDALLVGRDLLDMTALDLVGRLRRKGIPVPVMVLGTLSLDECVRALNLGADDAQPLPLRADELEARLRALVRRDRRAAPQIVIGALTVDVAAREARIGGHGVPMSNSVYKTLEALAVRAGHVVERGVILDALYHGRDEANPQIVDVFVCKVRHALGEHRTLLETISGRGWRLGLPGSGAPPPSALASAESLEPFVRERRQLEGATA